MIFLSKLMTTIIENMTDCLADNNNTLIPILPSPSPPLCLLLINQTMCNGISHIPLCLLLMTIRTSAE